ncbi:hypothetical protein [Aquimarina sediminis]|uniref:hypothetical protein n=1 Tax=Aquimarina sediminis TaxID=2070536 RepID=UPI000CA0670A|nr:hypothetical protein [Aquimarina sediminis]
MKKQILDLGKALNKAEQKTINGGYMPATCEELGWNEYTCNYVQMHNGGMSTDPNYAKCC